MWSRQRLSVASMWAFEEIGLEELQEEFRAKYPEYDIVCEYSPEDHIVMTKADSNDCAVEFAAFLSKFIEEKQDNDLLDLPRIQRLDDGLLRENRSYLSGSLPQSQKLVSVGSDSDEGIIHHSLTQVTKYWESSKGGLGCFSHLDSFTPANRGVLKAIGNVTGTIITVNKVLKNIKISGRSIEDVDDARAKLSRSEIALSVPRNSRMGNMMITSHDSVGRVLIHRYSTLNSVALSRILMDVTPVSHIPLNNMFTTVFVPFDPSTCSYGMTKNLASPPCISTTPSGPGKSRIWSVFTFQEIGNGEEFTRLTSMAENSNSHPRSGLTSDNPQQDGKLASDGAKDRSQEQMKGGSKLTPSHLSIRHMPADKKPSIVKIRKPVPVFSTSDKPSSQPVPSSSVSIKSQALAPKKATASRPAVASSKPIEDHVSSPENTPSQRAPASSKVIKDQVPSPEDTPSEHESGLAKPVKGKTLSPEDTQSQPAFTSPSSIKNQPTYPNENNQTPPRRIWRMNYSPPPAPEAPTSSLTQAAPAGHAGQNEYAITSFRTNWLTSSFDPTKYGHPDHQGAAVSATPRNQLPYGHSDSTPKFDRTPQNELIDVSSPVVTRPFHAHPPLRFDQPPLIPTNRTVRHQCHEDSQEGPFSPRHANNTSPKDLLGEERACSESPHKPRSGNVDLESSPQQEAHFSESDTQLLSLSRTLGEEMRDGSNSGDSISSPDKRHGQANKDLVNQVIIETEKVFEEMVQTAMEPKARILHRTMQQETAKPDEKPLTVAEKKAKHRTTIDDAWGSVEKETRFTLKGKGKCEKADQGNTQACSPSPLEQVAQDPVSIYANETIKSFFGALKPSLDAAEYFHGPLSLEVQVGIVLVPRLPRTHDGESITLKEWWKIFQPKTGVHPPTTKFVNTVTSSGSEVDYIVDLKASKGDSEPRLFEQEYTDYCVSYEFHCRTKTDQSFTIVIDEHGKYTIKMPTSEIGGANLHFPQHTWDACVIVNGVNEYVSGTDTVLDEGVKYLADSVWVPAGLSRPRILAKIPGGNKFVVEQVLMKRWTRHRHIRPATTGRPSPKDDGNECQDLFLQITEVQNLIIGISPSDPLAIRARSVAPSEMAKENRLWYEVSLISTAIEAVLQSNATLEVGERTEEWRATDLLGKDAILLSSTDAGSPPTLSPVAEAVGNAGLGDLLNLTRELVGKMDGVGYWNRGPYTGRRPKVPAIAGNRITTVSSMSETQLVIMKSNSSSGNRSTKGVDNAVVHVATPTASRAQAPESARVRAAIPGSTTSRAAGRLAPRENVDEGLFQPNEFW